MQDLLLILRPIASVGYLKTERALASKLVKQLEAREARFLRDLDLTAG